jgi:multiple sugar transport system substrate-binding protein
MKKTFALMMTVMLIAVIFAGCSKSGGDKATTAPAVTTEATKAPATEAPATVAPTTEPIKQVIIKVMNYTPNGGQEETYAEMVKLFEAANPGIKVEPEILAYADYFTKLNTVIGSGNSVPDVFEVGYEGFASYAAKNVLLDLTPTIAADTAFKPDVYKKLAYDAFNYGGKQYGVSESFSNVMLYYNKDLFDAKSVGYPQPSWTWKEELEAAKKLTDAKKGIWGTFAPIQFYEFFKTVAQNGGGIWSKDNKTLAINSKENVEALNWMLDKARKYKVSPALNDDTFNQPDADLNAFKAGKLAMLRAGVWNLGSFTKEIKFKWDVALEPGNTQKAHHFFADGLVASSTTKNADAVWKYIKFMSSDPAAVGVRIAKGWSIPAISDPATMDAYYKITPPDSRKYISEALDTLVLPPVGPIPDKWNDLQKAVSGELDKAKLGRIDAKKALDNAQANAEKLLK